MTSAEVIPTNHTCTNCGAKVIRATLAPPLGHEDQAWDFKWIILNPDWEHGGNIVVRASEAGRLFAKDMGTSPEEKRLLKHSCAEFPDLPEQGTWDGSMARMRLGMKP